MGIFGRKPETRPDKVMERGWQFYHRPTTLEPVGTVFRIDGGRRRYIVDTLTVPSTRGQEAAGRVDDQMEVGAGILARLLGIGPKADTQAGFTEKIEFQLSGPEREFTTDATLDAVLLPFLDNFKYRADNRYFLIRECRWATAMIYRLSKQRVLDLGGEAAVNAALELGARLKVVNERLYEIDCTFPQVMRVMFLPEEIKPVSAGLGGEGPRLGRVPVSEALVWEEADPGDNEE